jgi:hypothetical protein
MKYLTLVGLTLLLAACGPVATPIVTEEPAVLPSEALQATETSEVAVATEDSGPSFEAVVYTDPAGRFEISYPAGWMVDDSQMVAGSRGGYIQFSSFEHPEGGINEIPEGESVLQLATYLWDPVGDHEARLQMRLGNFLSSGNTILEEADFVFRNGQVGTRLLVLDTNGEESVVVLAVMGDEYLEISGFGDIALIDEIISTFEFTS